jgi:hypothetical protein
MPCLNEAATVGSRLSKNSRRLQLGLGQRDKRGAMPPPLHRYFGNP